VSAFFFVVLSCVGSGLIPMCGTYEMQFEDMYLT